MLNTHNSSLVSTFVYYVDMLCRTNLHNGLIVSARAYVSNLTNHLRYPFGPLISRRGVFAMTLSSKLESKIGCDFVIVLKKEDSVKILLFEAKWPRQSQNSYSWDSYMSSGSTNFPKWSRFSSQIKRQHDWRTS